MMDLYYNWPWSSYSNNNIPHGIKLYIWTSLCSNVYTQILNILFGMSLVLYIIKLQYNNVVGCILGISRDENNMLQARIYEKHVTGEDIWITCYSRGYMNNKKYHTIGTVPKSNR